MNSVIVKSIYEYFQSVNELGDYYILNSKMKGKSKMYKENFFEIIYLDQLNGQETKGFENIDFIGKVKLNMIHKSTFANKDDLSETIDYNINLIVDFKQNGELSRFKIQEISMV